MTLRRVSRYGRRRIVDVVMLMLSPPEAFGEAAPKAVVKKIAGFAMKLASEGKLKGGQQLGGLSEGFRIDGDGQSGRLLDGPYAELKELVAGYLELDVASMEEARDLASQNPHLAIGSVVVLPIAPRGNG